MRITLSGTLGSGKSTVGKELARRLNIPYISTGQIFRQLGQISSLDALQTNLEAETNRALDDAVDDKVREHNQNTPDFVIDSRMAWHFVDNALKVFLSVTPEVAARRIMSDRSRATEQYASPEAALDALRARRSSEIKRYKRLYKVDIEDPSNYDMSIITDDAEVWDVVDLILRRANGETHEKMWIPKNRLLPLIPAPAQENSGTSQKISLGEDFRLPVLLRANVGLFFGDAQELVQASRYELNLVPFEECSPESLPSRQSMASVLSRVTAGDFENWRNHFGIGAEKPDLKIQI